MRGSLFFKCLDAFFYKGAQHTIILIFHHSGCVRGSAFIFGVFAEFFAAGIGSDETVVYGMMAISGTHPLFSGMCIPSMEELEDLGATEELEASTVSEDSISRSELDELSSCAMAGSSSQTPAFCGFSVSEHARNSAPAKNEMAIGRLV